MAAVSTTGFLDLTTRFRMRRLLDRVGAVRDDDAGDVRHRDDGVDPIGELEPDLVVHVLRAYVRNLLALERGDLLGFGNCRDQLVDAHLARRVAGLDVRSGGAGDRAAGGEDVDCRQCLSGLRVEAQLRDAGNGDRQRQRDDRQRGKGTS
jgi:hypothetical protein